MQKQELLAMLFFKKIVFTTSICLLTISSFGMGQLFQYMYSHADVRTVELHRWANNDSNRLLQVKDFTRLCLSGGPAKPDGNEFKKPVSIEDCATANGLSSLFHVTTGADKILSSHAWPLSLIAG